MEDIVFQYYPARVDSKYPTGFVSLPQFIRAHLNPKPEVVEIFKQIEQAEIDNNKKLKAELKQNNLHYFTPCVVVEGPRRYVNIKKFTGLLVLDFDHIDNATDFKEHLFYEYKQVISAWLSPSKKGIKALIRIPKVQTIEQFKEYYYGVASEMDQYDGFDSCGQNAVLPLFQSYDPNLLLREDYSTWTIKGVKVNDLSAVVHSPPPYVQVTDADKNTCIQIIQSGFNNIGNVGHPPLRSLCLAIGGYVSTGYISDWEALQIIDYNIENHHYLKKGVSGYKETARWALNIGKKTPLILKHE